MNKFFLSSLFLLLTVIFSCTSLDNSIAADDVSIEADTLEDIPQEISIDDESIEVITEDDSLAYNPVLTDEDQTIILTEDFLTEDMQETDFLSNLKIDDPEETIEIEDIAVTIPPSRVIPVPCCIMGEGIIPADKLALFLMFNNQHLDFNYVLVLARLYIEEAEYEGVNHDIAFAQMCLETGFLRFGNLVTADQYNFAGLGATGLPDADGIPEKGMYFPSPRIGVRAHVQHLKAYASADPLNGELVNPRRRFVNLGSSPTIEGLAGTWAADRLYAEKIGMILERLYDFALN